MNHSHPSAPAACPQIAVIVPACNEEACLGAVLVELLAALDPGKYVVAVGVNDSFDRTAQIARKYPVLVGETRERGYGHGCRAAIEAVTKAWPDVGAYVFFAGDGASDPHDIGRLVAAYERGSQMVLGARTGRRANWRTMGFSHVLANVALACWCGLLTGRRFTDLAPLRLIERRLFEAIEPREMTFGWTIEAQIAAAMLGATIEEVSAKERSRLAGEQKVSGVTWRRTVLIGCRILAAGWRTRTRSARVAAAASLAAAPEMLPQSQSGA
ncbi:MAG: glycosyltransferase family 2 protein [Chthoniobacterales bacterium]